MISVSPQWPWQRIDAARRQLVILALILISASGFVSGLALRPVLHAWATVPTSPHVAAQTQAGQTYQSQATAVPALTPQLFGATLTLAPRQIQRGAALTITVQAQTAQLANPASGVLCAVSMAGLSGAALAPRMTDSAGAATWTLTLPRTLAPGTHLVKLRATWGRFTATFEVSVTVK